MDQVVIRGGEFFYYFRLPDGSMMPILVTLNQLMYLLLDTPFYAAVHQLAHALFSYIGAEPVDLRIFGYDFQDNLVIRSPDGRYLGTLQRNIVPRNAGPHVRHNIVIRNPHGEVVVMAWINELLAANDGGRAIEAALDGAGFADVEAPIDGVVDEVEAADDGGRAIEAALDGAGFADVEAPIDGIVDEVGAADDGGFADVEAPIDGVVDEVEAADDGGRAIEAALDGGGFGEVEAVVDDDDNAGVEAALGRDVEEMEVVVDGDGGVEAALDRNVDEMEVVVDGDGGVEAALDGGDEAIEQGVINEPIDPPSSPLIRAEEILWNDFLFDSTIIADQTLI